jgi:hypothetical protein
MQVAKFTNIASPRKKSRADAWSRTVDDKYWQIGEKMEEMTPARACCVTGEES